MLFAFVRQQNSDLNFATIIDIINQINIPEFTLKGKDLIDLGLTEYGKIKNILETLEQHWIENNFKDTKEELLKKAKTLF
mgnify:CR=1 FL=1